MNLKQLHQQLDQLRQDATTLDDADEATRAHIVELVDRVTHQIDNPEDLEHKANLVARTTEAIEQFEIEHPQVTDTLNRIMIALGV